MDKSEFIKQINKIEIAYNKKFSREELKMWYEELKSISSEQFAQIISVIIKENKFVPKIAEVKSKIGNSLHKLHAKDEFRHLYKNLEWCMTDKFFQVLFCVPKAQPDLQNCHLRAHNTHLLCWRLRPKRVHLQI